MHRCINDIFSYCTRPSNIQTRDGHIPGFDYRGRTTQIPSSTYFCPHDPKYCPHLITQSQLHRIRTLRQPKQ